MRWPWPAALAAAVVTGTLAAAGVVLAGLTPTRETVAWAAIGGAAAAVSVALGAVIVRHTRRNVVGTLLTLVGIGVAFTSTRETGWIVLAHHPGSLASLSWLVALLAES